MPGSPARPEADRFWEKVDIEGPDGCWLWTAAVTHDGYGRFRVGEKQALAHRWAYEHLVGPTPEGLELDHLCRAPACVRPDHLEPVDHRENLRRGYKSRGSRMRHGTTSMYVHGCRCRPCTDAAAVYNRGLKARKRAEAANLTPPARFAA